MTCPAGKVPLGGGTGVSDLDDDDASVSSAGLVDMDFVFAGSDGSKGWKGAFSANLDLAVRVPYRATV